MRIAFLCEVNSKFFNSFIILSLFEVYSLFKPSFRTLISDLKSLVSFTKFARVIKSIFIPVVAL